MLKTHLRHYRVLSIVYWNTVTFCYNLLTSARSFGLITVNILADLDILCDVVVSKRWSWRHTLLYIALTYFHLIFSQQFYYWLSCQWKYLRSPVYRKVSFFVIAETLTDLSSDQSAISLGQKTHGLFTERHGSYYQLVQQKQLSAHGSVINDKISYPMIWPKTKKIQSSFTAATWLLLGTFNVCVFSPLSRACVRGGPKTHTKKVVVSCTSCARPSLTR